MTEKQAALKTYILWSGIEVNQLKVKWDYPLFFTLSYNSLIYSCPFCAFHGQNTSKLNPLLCESCPLVGCGNYSNWAKWFDHGDPIAAGNIAAIAWAEYKRLGG